MTAQTLWLVKNMTVGANCACPMPADVSCCHGNFTFERNYEKGNELRLVIQCFHEICHFMFIMTVEKKIVIADTIQLCVFAQVFNFHNCIFVHKDIFEVK